jgi:hypothetical protein
MPRTTHGFTPTAPALVFVVLCVDILKVTQTIEPEKDARLRHHPSILRDPDETPEDPDAPDNGDRSPAEGVVNELESRLFKPPPVGSRGVGGDVTCQGGFGRFNRGQPCNSATAHRILASSGGPTARWGAARNPRANVRPA